MSAAPYFFDPASGKSYPLQDVRWCSDDQRPLLISDLPGITADDIQRDVHSLWRYQASLPLPIASPVTLGEGLSPLVEMRWGTLRPKFKLDWFNPTCSFKDRGSSVMVSHLKQIGVERILEDSSGNGGASVAAYGAAAGISVKILCPESVSPTKVVQMQAFGAEVELIPGSREATQAAAVAQSAEIFYASHNWHPFFLQGTKTIAYEIWESLGFRAPNNVIMPVGAGSSLLGCHIGFGELLRAGQIKRMPRLFATQPLNCSPIDAHFHAAAGGSTDRPVRPTIAEGTAISQPLRLKEILHAIRNSGGSTVAIEDRDILSTTHRLARHGLLVEPTSAGAAAGLDILMNRGELREEEETIVLLTGTGAKTPQAFSPQLQETSK